LFGGNWVDGVVVVVVGPHGVVVVVEKVLVGVVVVNVGIGQM